MEKKHQTLPSEQSNYLITIHLETSEDPTVTRLLSIPPNFTFEQVHVALQIAFNWSDIHLHTFNVWLSDYKGPTICDTPCGPGALKLRINSGSDDGLSDDEDDVPTTLESDITLAEVYENPNYRGKAVIGYEYDLCDSWAHTFCLIGRASPDMHAQFHAPPDLEVFCFGGEGHHVAEDSGGGEGWEAVKEAFKKGKKGDPDDLREWYREMCANGEKGVFHPYKWSIFDINERLAQAFCPDVLKPKGTKRARSDSENQESV
ncbi:MAG: hypothetical protein Q9159_002571 [Coniocarpon cinnabarinum]